MSAESESRRAPAGASPIEGYYALHSRIYDATRWTFLFGRDAILKEVASMTRPKRVLEVGCGTGKNIAALCRRFPEATVTGVDLSEAMLQVARRKTESFGSKVTLIRRAYDSPLGDGAEFDLALFSYALSMFNPGYETAIAAARRDVVPGGHIAVVDFHDSPVSLFERWMGVNHVRMQAHLRPELTSNFTPVLERVRAAYGGVWRYLMFVGRQA